MKNIILVLVAMVFLGNAQNAKMKIGIKINPEWTEKFGDDYEKKNGGYFITYKFNYLKLGFGLQLVTQIRKNLSIETGMYIHKQKFSFRKEGVFKIYDVNGWFNYFKDDYTEVKTFRFLQIPICIRYDVPKIAYATLGITSNLQLETKRSFSDGSTHSKGDADDYTFGAGLLATAGREWSCKNNFSFITEFRVGGIPGRAAGINIGLGIGANYKL
jgi:hypothetical protein